MKTHFYWVSAFVLSQFMAHGVVALETSAVGGADMSVLNGVNARIEAGEAALTTTINKILTCNNKKMIYASDTSVPGRDADGCVSNAGTILTRQIFSAGASGNELLNIPGSWTACALTEEYASKSNSLYCRLREFSAGSWTLEANDQHREGGQCSAVCFKLN